jgi:hypothetical protein
MKAQWETNVDDARTFCRENGPMPGGSDNTLSGKVAKKKILTSR